MSALFKIIKEQILNLYLIRRLSFYEVKSANNNNYLGIAWELINPAIQISIYWFIFGIGIRERADVKFEGVTYNYLEWMLAGIVIWFFVNPSIMEGSKSIHRRIRMISKMSFPMSIIPSYVILSKLYVHLILTSLIFIVIQFLHPTYSVNLIQLPYYVICVTVLVFAVTLITSTLTTIVRDIQIVLQSIMRILLYTSPFLWEITDSDKIPDIVKFILKLNPLYYVASGYRSSILGNGWYFIAHWEYSLYFWVLVFLLFVIGSAMHLRFRDHFIDYM